MKTILAYGACALLALLFLSAPASAQTYVNASTGSNMTGSGPLQTIATAASSATSGNHLAVAVRWAEYNGLANPAITDTAGNTYNATGCDRTESSMGTGNWLKVYYAENIVGNANNVVTATWSGMTEVWFASIIVLQHSGVSQGSSYDTCATGTGLTPSGCVTGMYTTTSANEVLVTFAQQNDIGFAWTAGSSATLRTQDASNVVGAQSRIVTGIQTGQTSTMTSAGSGTECTAVVTTFKAQTGAISYVNATEGREYTGTPVTVKDTLPFNVSTGNHLTVMVRWQPGGASDPTLTDLAGNTFIPNETCPAFANGAGTKMKTFHVGNSIAHTSNVISAWFADSTNYISILALQHSGVSGSAALQACSSNTGSTPTLTTGTFSTTGNALVVTFASQETSATAWSAGSGATLRIEDGFQVTAAQSRTYSTNQTNITQSMSNASSGFDGNIIAVVFAEGTPTGGGGARKWLLRGVK